MNVEFIICVIIGYFLSPMCEIIIKLIKYLWSRCKENKKIKGE